MYLFVLDEAVGCVLRQHDDSGKREQAVYYLSKKFTPYETKYTFLERSRCALVWATQKLRHYLLSHTTYFISRSDPLKCLVVGKAEDMNERCAEWRLFFDGGSNSFGVGIEAVLVSPKGKHYPGSAKLRFFCTNNMAEYEASSPISCTFDCTIDSFADLNNLEEFISNFEAKGSLLQILCSKLLAVRRGIQGWNKQFLGNIFDAVREAEVGLLRAEDDVANDDSEGHSGDRNSKYFHAVVKQRQVQGMIHRVKRADGVWVEDDDGIAIEAIAYFSNLFSGDTSSNLDGLLGLIPSMITGEDNMVLEKIPTMEEVRRDVHKAVVSFFCGVELTRFITSTSIVLIPKTGFVKGRNITENYLLAQELVTGIGKKARGGNVALKLDMAKEYDRMPWFHVIHVLRKFGFGERFIDIVWWLVSNVGFSVIINGVSNGFFKSSRGLRQGDPLSPVLFVIGAEVLSREIYNLARQGGYVGFRVPRDCPTVTHLAFVDDVIIFSNGSTAALKRIMQVLGAYQRLSGQLVNAHKSGYLVHSSLPPVHRRVIERVTHFSRQTFPFRALDVRCGFARLGVQNARKGVRQLPMGCFGRRNEVSLDWLFRAGSSLWASFMRAKYCRDLHSCQVQLGRYASGTWRRMLNISKQVELSVIWALFFKATANPALSFEDFIVNGKWTTDLLSRALPLDLIPSVLLHPVPRGGRTDEIIWRLTSSGKILIGIGLQGGAPSS
nr:uncharacterized protein LOC113696683 [Coffea arabica]